MGKDSRRRAKKESRQRRRIAVACARDDTSLPPTSILDIPDDLLEHILLRVRTHACLFRAAATCKTWRCVVAGTSFLRRFHSLHGQDLLIGHYCVNIKKMEDGIERLNAEFFPCPPRPTNHLRQRLSLDFLPQPRPYSHSHQRVLTDSRGGLLAFVQDNWYTIICDPWTRQYTELHFPWGQREEDRDFDYQCIGAFLLDADDGDGSPMSSFMVLCACLVRNKDQDTVTAHACVYSARQNCWLRGSEGSMDIHSGYWTATWGMHLLDTYTQLMGRAGGTIFWFGIQGHVLALNENTCVFSTIRLPGAPDVINIYWRPAHQLYHKENVRIVGSRAAGYVRIVSLLGGGVLEVFTRFHGAWMCTMWGIADLCRLVNFEARPHQLWRFVDTDTITTPATVVLGAVLASSSVKLFSLDVDTMKLRRLDDMTTTLCAERVFPFELPWPQTISTCL
ncbi:unnamed protein product [Urochloa humidicola]